MSTILGAGVGVRGVDKGRGRCCGWEESSRLCSHAGKSLGGKRDVMK
jgi:hypothetical protein